MDDATPERALLEAVEEASGVDSRLYLQVCNAALETRNLRTIVGIYRRVVDLEKARDMASVVADLASTLEQRNAHIAELQEVVADQARTIASLEARRKRARE